MIGFWTTFKSHHSLQFYYLLFSIFNKCIVIFKQILRQNLGMSKQQRWETKSWPVASCRLIQRILPKKCAVKKKHPIPGCSATTTTTTSLKYKTEKKVTRRLHWGRLDVARVCGSRELGTIVTIPILVRETSILTTSLTKPN